MQYVAFSGTLPAPSMINLNLVGAQIQTREPTFGITCVYLLTPERPLAMGFAREAGGGLSSLTLSGTVPTSCMFDGFVGGTSNSLTVLNSASRITVTLI